MNQPIVSVIIPVYNTGPAAKSLIEFLLNKEQYQHLEIIAVDDGSTDDSLKILKSIVDKDSRLRVFHQKNGGASSARNLGIKHASGQYIAFIDSDDMVTKDYLKKLVAATEKGHVALATSAYLYHRVRKNSEFPLYTNSLPGRKKSETYNEYLLRLLVSDGRLYAVINKLFRTQVIKDHNIKFDTSLNFAEDLKFVLEYLRAAGDGDLAFVLEPLYIYYYGTETSTVAKSSLKWSNWQQSYSNVKNWLGPSPTKRERLRLAALKKRWQISHALAVARANQSYREKRENLGAVSLFLASLAVKFRR